jgi:hypothetical protein
VTEASFARLECLVGIALGGLAVTAGAVLPSPWFRLLIVVGAVWAVIALALLMGTTDWDAKSASSRRRLVWGAHWCGVFPVFLAAGVGGASVGSGTSLDPEDLRDRD